MSQSTPAGGVEAGPAALADLPDPRRWLALAVMCFTVLLISLDATVLNVALPTIIESLHPSAAGVQWIADSYTLTEAVLLLVCGAVGDRIGRRRTFLVGVAVFGTGSAACAFAHDSGVLIGARAVTGLGAALLMPATLSLIAATFPSWERPRAIGLWAGVSGIGTAAGPLLGGWLLESFWWGSVFIINVPIAVLALVGGRRFVAESRSKVKPPVDPLGVVLSAVGMAAVTYALIVAPEQGWLSVTVLAGLAGGMALLVLFAVWDGRQEHPLVDFSLFRNPTFSTALGTVTAAFFALFGISFLLSQYIQFVQQATVFAVGLRFVPMAAGTLVGSNSATRLTARFGLRSVIVGGMSLVCGALVIYSTLQVTKNPLPIAGAFALAGVGIGVVIAPASNAVIGSLPPDKVGVGSGLRSTVQLLGGSFGVAILGNLATSRYKSTVVDALRRGSLATIPASARSAVSSQIGGAVAAARQLPKGTAAHVKAVADNAFVSGVRLGSEVDLAITVLAIVAVARFVPSSKVAPEHSAGAAEMVA